MSEAPLFTPWGDETDGPNKLIILLVKPPPNKTGFVRPEERSRGASRFRGKVRLDAAAL